MSQGAAETLLSRWLPPARMRLVFAAAGALLVFNLVVAAFGHGPAETLSRAFAGTWGTAYGTGQVLFKATPLLLTGLAFHVALRGGLFNIGTEGQLALGALVAGWLGPKLGGLPWPVALPLVIGAAITVAAAYSAIAGVMRARLGVHEIISCIMLNRCVDVFLPWVLVAGLGATSLRTDDLGPGARLPGLETWIPALSGSAVSVAFPLAVLITFGAYAWLERSRAGREMRWVGLGAAACEAQGIDVRKRQVQAMVLSGALAGLVCTGTVLGYKGYYELGLGAGAGFSGIAVAMVGRSGPLALVASALVFGTLAQAGLTINAQVPKEAMNVLEAVVILLVAAASGVADKGRAAVAVPDERDDASEEAA